LFSIVDGHCDTVFHMIKEQPKYNFWRENHFAHLDFPRLKKGGVRIQFFAVCTEYLSGSESSHLPLALKMVEKIRQIVEAEPKSLQLLYGLDDLESVIQSDRVGIILSLEGGKALEADLDILSVFYRLGLRSLGFTWNKANELGYGIGSKEKEKGLTDFGKTLVPRLNQLGIVIDAAHLNERCFWELNDLSSAPYIVSHANAYQLCPHPRNLTKDQLKALARSGGVIGVSFYPKFIRTQKANLDDLLNHFVYISEVAGPEVVGFGSDFDGIKNTLPELPDSSCYLFLIDALRKKGFSEEEIKGIAGGNFLRVLKKVLPR